MTFQEVTEKLVLGQKAKRRHWKDLYISISKVPSFWGDNTYLKHSRNYFSLYIPSKEDETSSDWEIF